MKPETLSVGLCQLRQTYDYENNLKRSLLMAEEAASRGAEVVVFTEMFFSPYEPKAISEAAFLTPVALEEMARTATERNLFIVAGTVPFQERGGRYLNRSCVFAPGNGEIYHHDKLHLFDSTPPGGPSMRESGFVRPGNRLGSFPLPWGMASVIVCYDMRFPQVTQILADRGATILFVPAAFSHATGRAHWEMLVRLRAVELQGFVVGVQPACNPDLRYVPWGHSMAANPWGEVVVDMGQEEGIEVVSLVLSDISRLRSQFPLLAHRRTDLYGVNWMEKA
ncbi:MAG: nitrilase-related carbon-nitrogen hydrolase [Desulfomonilia bacterium]|nr:nitrilase-related carbon-nitrogen hydrolase [Desulfomonilia bacterium]